MCCQSPTGDVAHANVGLNDTIWSVPIDRIPFNARFRLINGVLVPMFASSDRPGNAAGLAGAPEVRLVFAVRTEFVGRRRAESTATGSSPVTRTTGATGCRCPTCTTIA